MGGRPGGAVAVEDLPENQPVAGVNKFGAMFRKQIEVSVSASRIAEVAWGSVGGGSRI
jgi:hypothetical protein